MLFTCPSFDMATAPGPIETLNRIVGGGRAVISLDKQFWTKVARRAQRAVQSCYYSFNLIINIDIRTRPLRWVYLAVRINANPRQLYFKDIVTIWMLRSLPLHK